MLNKVTDGIYKLIVRYPFGMREVNSYLINGEKGYTVIDTGSYSDESIAIWEQVLASGIIIEKVVLTHAHPDHIGLAGWFQKRIGVPVFISDLGYQEMKRNREKGILEKQFKRLLTRHGGPEVPTKIMFNEASAFEFEPDGTFGNHQKIRLGDDQYEAIWTPGHAADHICFYNEQEEVMIIGDHVLQNISPIVGVSSENDGNPLSDYFASLKLIESGYPAKIALPGHGELILNLNQRIKEIRTKHEHRLQQALQSVNSENKQHIKFTRIPMEN